ncbi:TIGR03618 family F420-dependent PPOX class oxidoreductase [Streptomyces sp. SID1034]|nr:TIGR03618 family F420-dependent PPOX class oxidoreductase [Streptomyces sp. SID1034]MYV94719.1 TIGR03618 family F420-dependent PPOX class oxidoreductase [Streptomyces sp. SID1034]
MEVEAGPRLAPEVRALADGPNFAALTTLMRDGTPQTQIVWVSTVGDHLALNSEVARQKVRNLRRDPRATVTIWQHDDPLNFAEIRGRVVKEVLGAEAREHIDELSTKYLGGPFADEFIASDRVMLLVEPDRQLVRNHARWVAGLSQHQ